MAKGIKDKVAIIGMGCSRFGERWDCGPEELIVEAFKEAEAGGLASIQVDGRFVDYPIVQKAERILAIADKIAAKKG